MKMSVIIGFLLVNIITLTIDDQQVKPVVDVIDLSVQLLTKVENNEPSEEIQDLLCALTEDQLETQLANDKQKMTFWVNIYNAYVKILLRKNPALYENKKTFFSKERFCIAGISLSLNKIEHGFIRRSQVLIGLGYLSRWFPGALERKFRVDKRDWRAHFALNCGAKSCPPVIVYRYETLDEQLDKSTSEFLLKNTEYNKEANQATTTALFSWFRGDFGGKSGMKQILVNHELIPSKNVKVKYGDYDWTLSI